MTFTRGSLFMPLMFAAMFGIVSLMLGFGLALSAASAIIGAISGSAFVDRTSRQMDPPSRAALQEIIRSLSVRNNEATMTSRSTNTQPDRNIGRILSGFPGIDMSAFQRVATRAFLIQGLVGLVAIIAFWIAQATGLNVHWFDTSAFTSLFHYTFSDDATSAAARTRFDNLYVPLASLYAGSLLALAVAFLSSLGPILRNFKKHKLFLFVPLFGIITAAMLLGWGTPTDRLYRLIINGHVWGYFVLFVLFPFSLLMMTASLPNEQSR